MRLSSYAPRDGGAGSAARKRGKRTRHRTGCRAVRAAVRSLSQPCSNAGRAQKSDGSGESSCGYDLGSLACRPEHIDTPCISDSSGYGRVFQRDGCSPETLSSYIENSAALLRGCKIQGVEGSMDETNQWKKAAASPSTDDDNDALAKRLSENWASSAPHAQRMGGQVLQKLRNGRVRVVVVESTRSRRRPVSL